MFNILIHKGDTNENDTEIPSHPSQNGYHKTTNAGENGGSSYTLLVEM
jgi:hypothetical protein